MGPGGHGAQKEQGRKTAEMVVRNQELPVTVVGPGRSVKVTSDCCVSGQGPPCNIICLDSHITFQPHQSRGPHASCRKSCGLEVLIRAAEASPQQVKS